MPLRRRTFGFPGARAIRAFSPIGGGGVAGPALPTVTVEATDATASETSGTGEFTFTRTGSTSGALVVHYTVTGTATPTTDYTALSGTATILDGNASVAVTVTAAADAVTDPAETVIVTIDADAAYSVGSPNSATVTITDTTAVVTIVATTATATEGGATGLFTVSRTGSTSGALTVNYTVTGTATSGTDYTSIGTSVVIGDGNASATVTVTALADAVMDNAETVIVTLAAGSYAIGSPSAATVTITDATTPLTIATANSQVVSLWLKSDVGVSLSGSNVTTWADQSGNGRDGTSAGGTEPVYSATSFLGGPGITFDATAELTLASATPNESYTAWLVAAPNNTGNRLLLRSSATAHGIGHAGSGTTQKQRLSSGVTLDHTVGTTDADPVSSRYAWTVSSTQRVFGSGLSEETNTGSTLQPTFDRVGTTASGWIGVVAEIIVISGNHAAGSQVVTQMEAYIAARYPSL